MNGAPEPDDELRRRALETAFAHSPDASYLLAPDGHFLAGNRALSERTGVPWEELSETGFDPTVHPDDREHVRAEFEAAAAGEERRFRARGMRPDGTVFHAEVAMIPIRDHDEVVAIAGIAHDIDELTGIRTSLHRTESRLVAAFDGIGDAIAFVDGEWRFTFVNAQAEMLFGRRRDELIGSVMWDLDLPDPEGEAMLREVMTSRRTLVHRRFDDQLQRWMEVSGFPAGDLLGIQVRDVTELENARRRTQDDTRLFYARSMLMDDSRDAIFMRGLGGDVEYANASAGRWFDAGHPSELIGRRLVEVLGLDETQSREIEGVLAREGLWRGDLVMRPRPGVELVTENHWSTVVGPDGSPDAVFCIIVDVTEQRRQDDLLTRTQRMESIGTLASGIAHDLNNVLTPLLLSTQLLAAGESDPSRQRVLEGMRQTVERGSDMIRQVLTFARGVEGERVVVDVAGLARRFSEFCRDILPKDIVVEVESDDGLAVLGDPTQLLQVLMNLATNARDAMPSGGTLRLRATGDAEHVLIEVADEGSGMSADVLARVFEPFFTTKGIGRGTGLGLPVSQAIARTHGGSLEATSRPGRGTTFRLELPRTEPIGSDDIDAASSPIPDLAGLRVLVVDDEDDIVEAAGLVIGAAGGIGTGARDADDAREQLAAGGIDVVVTDLVMPGTTGRRFLDLLAAEHPHLPVVSMSGVPEQAAHASRRPNVRAVLDKPFTTDRLLEAILTAAGRG